MILTLRRSKHSPRDPEHKTCKKGDVTSTDSSDAEEDVLECKTEQRDPNDTTMNRNHLDYRRGAGVKAVAFDHQVVVRLIKGRKELSDREKNDVWYSSVELQRIRGETRTTLCLMNSKTDIPTNFETRFCTRGLEGRTRKALRSRSRIREAVWTAVFEEQSTQQVESTNDPLAIAEAATVASRRAKQMARDVALRDEIEAQECEESSQQMVISIPMSVSLMKPIELCRWPLW